MPAVAETVCRPFDGRHRAGTRPAPTVAARGLEHQWLSQPFLLSTTVGHTKGALRGESPRTSEGRRPDRPELQWSVISSQWSEAMAVALIGDANWL